MEIERLPVRHTFTDQERLELGEQQARLLLKSDELEATLKSVKAQVQAQIEECDAGIRVVSSKFRDRSEFRDIDCLALDHRINGMRHLIRTDTGHVVKVRKLSPYEQQQKLLPDEEPQPYVATGTFPVDDNTVETDFLLLNLYADEVELLKNCPDVRLLYMKEKKAAKQ
jgi:hypothetical protein